MSGHTPGPWTVDVLTASDPNGDEWETDVEIIGPSGRHIMSHDLGYRDDVDAEIKATARLIAAAPDLLDALQDALDAWDNHNQSGDMMQGDWVSDARAAIAKATGGAA